MPSYTLGEYNGTNSRRQNETVPSGLFIEFAFIPVANARQRYEVFLRQLWCQFSKWRQSLRAAHVPPLFYYSYFPVVDCDARDKYYEDNPGYAREYDPFRSDCAANGTYGLIGCSMVGSTFGYVFSRSRFVATFA